jgi:L-amino acid N-acyltransferase YncA
VVESRALSFEIVGPTMEEMAARMIGPRPTQPWLVAKDRQRLPGYAWARPFATRAAYEWPAEGPARRDGANRGKPRQPDPHHDDVEACVHVHLTTPPARL